MFRYFLFAVFILSGLSALVYEVVWSQYLRMLLGHSAYAQALVLMVFMGGMSLGAWAVARLSNRLRTPLLAYLMAEAVLGILALMFHPIFLAIEGIYQDLLLALAPGPWLLVGIKGLLSGVLILPQSVLLGATFPLLSAVLVRRQPERRGELLANLYFTNSLGAALGALVTGFALVPQFGLPASLAVAALINLLIAALISPVAWQEFRSRRPAGKNGETDRSRRADAGSWLPFLLTAAFVTGAASFLYEIAWIRLLSLVLGASTHAFELMLSAFILGLALGGYWVRRHIDRLRDPTTFLGAVQVAMGLLALLSFPLYTGTFFGMEFILRGLARNDQGYLLYQWFSHSVALAVMLPATFCAGATLPLLTDLLCRKGGGERSFGGVYAANTLGAIAGVLLAVFGTIPLIGLKGTLMTGAALDVGLGLVLLALSAAAARNYLRPLGLAAAVAWLFALVSAMPQDPLLLNSQVYRHQAAGILRTGTDTIYYRDGPTASVFVGESRNGTRFLKVNGKTDASISPAAQPPVADEITQILTAALPLVIHPEARRALVIGFGSGQTSSVLLTYPGLDHLDTVEIEQRVVEAGQHFRPASDLVFDDLRSRIWIDDGRSFMARPGAAYDLIVSEPSNPWVSGVSSLFTSEFYRQAVGRLADGGLLVQWLQLYEMDAKLLASVFNAMTPHCRDYAAYDAGGQNILVLCAPGSRSLNPVNRELFEHPEIARLLSRVEVNSLADFAVRRLGSKIVLAPLFRQLSAQVNSDFDPILEYQAPRHRFLGSGVSELAALQDTPLPLLPLADPLFALTPEDDLTPTRYNRRAQRIYQAHSFLRRFLSDDPGTADSEPGADLARMLNDPECERRQQALEAGLYRAAAALQGSVPLGDIDRFWQRVLASPCIQGLESEALRWPLFLRATTLLQSPKMGTEADSLLTSDNATAGRFRPLLVGAVMLSALQRRDPVYALDAYRAYGGDIPLRGYPPLLAVVGMAKEGVAQVLASRNDTRESP